MWDNSRSEIRRTVITIVLIIVAIALFIGLFYAYVYVNAANEEQDAQLKLAYEQQKLEQAEARAASLNEVYEEYDKDVQTVQTYMPGIVCWGDTLTVGSSGSVSYPSTLQNIINENICDIYDFRSTIENSADYGSRITWKDYKVEIPVVNMGVNGEDCNTILGRNGAVPFVLSNKVTIPAECEKVAISIKSSNGSNVYPLKQGDSGVNDVIINDIVGNLSYESSTNKYYFTRNTAGEETIVEAGTEIITSANTLYENYITVVWLGSYGGYSNVDDLVKKTKAIIGHQQSNNDRYLVIGSWSQKNDYSSYYVDYNSIETKMAQEFGNHFINIRKYLVTDGLDDANITETTQDTKDIKAGHIPRSLMVTGSSTELNATGYKLVGNVVYDKMQELGYFDEIEQELGIKETRLSLYNEGKYEYRS